MKNRTKYIILTAFLIAAGTIPMHAQQYMRADGKKIVDQNGSNFIIRSIGTGNWMLQEGYMMKTSGIAGTQHEFRAKLIETIGMERTDSFYSAWLGCHMSKADIDSMKAWGFNAIRPALHYKWFTPPIEDEPVAGEITWIDKGFEMVDSLLSWCEANEMYVILDMHGTPGGQGTDAAISDYDPTKPSLWESQANKDKLIALWQKIAERYNEEPWIGGYDLINEPNWAFDEEGNAPLWQIYQDITEAIREVDTNHMIILEGNWFANNYDGLPALWDDNLVLSFHKYWTYNDEASIKWMMDLRNQRNAPIWLGESGENSNTWFTNLIALCESKNIGWSWWPVKKAGVNNILQVKLNSEYDQLTKSWNDEADPLTAEETFEAVLGFAENHKIENCIVQQDVIDAMIRQPKSYDSQPFHVNQIGDKIFCTEYDYGRNNVAYLDKDTANYRLSTGMYVSWNKGGVFRNDGVDIQECEDNFASNGYHVGWTEAGEWMQYTLETDSAALYSLEIRSAAESSGSIVHLELDGEIISEAVQLPTTGDWQSWANAYSTDILIPAGTNKLRFHIDREGSNLNYFTLNQPRSAEDLVFTYLLSRIISEDQRIHIALSKDITEFDTQLALDDFTLIVNGEEKEISAMQLSTGSNRQIILSTSADLLYNQTIELSYNGSSVKAGEQFLEAFTLEPVINHLLRHTAIPAKIEAEDYTFNNGFEIEECEDINGGKNMSYADAGDYLDYKIIVPQAGHYKMDLRLAADAGNSELAIQTNASGTMQPLATLKVNNTQGWQNWNTQSVTVYLQEGSQIVRILVNRGPFNFNWLKFEEGTNALNSHTTPRQFNLFPNPTHAYSTIRFIETSADEKQIQIVDTKGILRYKSKTNDMTFRIDTTEFDAGVYFVIVGIRKERSVAPLLIN